jgi:hypothetical protein
LFLGFFEEGSAEETKFLTAAESLRGDDLAQFALATERDSADGKLAFAQHQAKVPSVIILRNDAFDEADRIVKVDFDGEILDNVKSIKKTLLAHSTPPVSALEITGKKSGATKKWLSLGDDKDGRGSSIPHSHTRLLHSLPYTPAALSSIHACCTPFHTRLLHSLPYTPKQLYQAQPLSRPTTPTTTYRSAAIQGGTGGRDD